MYARFHCFRLDSNVPIKGFSVQFFFSFKLCQRCDIHVKLIKDSLSNLFSLNHIILQNDINLLSNRTLAASFFLHKIYSSTFLWLFFSYFISTFSTLQKIEMRFGYHFSSRMDWYFSVNLINWLLNQSTSYILQNLLNLFINSLINLLRRNNLRIYKNQI